MVQSTKARRSITLDQAIAGVGRKILERCRSMVEADGAYAALLI